MSDLKITHCPTCDRDTAHDLYVSQSGALHALCTDCGKDVRASADLASTSGGTVKPCRVCGTRTEHVRYTDTTGYLHWFCMSCGKDIRSSTAAR
jgi:DNA-directed RNA polymerase subunit RPC12/RpoP